MKGSIKIHHAKATQLRHCVISSLQHQYGVEEKLNESGFRIFTQVRKLKIQLKILG